MTSLPHPMSELHESSPLRDIPKMGMHVKRNLPQKGKRGHGPNKAMVPAMGNELRNLRRARNWTIEHAATAMSMSYGGYLKLERGERRLKVEQIAKAAEVFKVPQSDVIGSQIIVYIVGELFGTGSVKLFDKSNCQLELAPAPDDATPSTRAYVVQEGALLSGFAEDDWLVYHDEPLKFVPDEWIGKVCFCELEDGSIFVCRIHYGREKGLYDLVGFGSDIRRNIRLKSIALVTWIKQQ